MNAFLRNPTARTMCRAKASAGLAAVVPARMVRASASGARAVVVPLVRFGRRGDRVGARAIGIAEPRQVAPGFRVPARLRLRSGRATRHGLTGQFLRASGSAGGAVAATLFEQSSWCPRGGSAGGARARAAGPRSRPIRRYPGVRAARRRRWRRSRAGPRRVAGRGLSPPAVTRRRDAALFGAQPDFAGLAAAGAPTRAIRARTRAPFEPLVGGRVWRACCRDRRAARSHRVPRAARTSRSAARLPRASEAFAHRERSRAGSRRATRRGRPPPAIARRARGFAGLARRGRAHANNASQIPFRDSSPSSPGRVGASAVGSEAPRAGRAPDRTFSTSAPRGAYGSERSGPDPGTTADVGLR